MADPPGKILPPKAPRPPQGGQIAKPDLLTPPAAPIPRRPPTKSEDRVLMLDKQPVNLNGFYEAVPADAKTHSGFTMQVNQAGLMLVGWISETPSVVKPVTPIKTLPMLPSGERIGFAVFSAPLKPSPIRSLKAGECFVSFQWVAFARPVENINLFDLTLWGSQKGEERSGTLRLEYVLDPDYAYLGVRTKSLGRWRPKAGRSPV